MKSKIVPTSAVTTLLTTIATTRRATITSTGRASVTATRRTAISATRGTTITTAILSSRRTRWWAIVPAAVARVVVGAVPAVLTEVLDTGLAVSIPLAGDMVRLFDGLTLGLLPVDVVKPCIMISW